MSLVNLAFLVPLFPLIGSIINGFFGLKIGKDRVSWVACAGPVMSFVVTLILLVGTFFHTPGTPYPEQSLFTWIAAGDLTVDFGFQIDPLSLVMMMVVTGVGSIIHIYSIGYMYAEYSYYRYFAYLNLFLFSMLLLVMGNNFLVMFIGWEGVGVCSYFLIGYYFEKKSACDAGVKAFVVNRIGDFAFLLGVFGIFKMFGTIDFTEVMTAAPTTLIFDGEAATLITLALFIGATGKSAQIPLYTWLPDAMEGPTPVSALIHAATMVTAGVYMVVRCNALFNMAPLTMMIIALVGGGYCVVCRNDWVYAMGHQTRVGLFHCQSDRLHVPGLRRWRLHGGDLSPGHARILQSLPVPRFRKRDTRHASRTGHPQDGRTERSLSNYVRHVSGFHHCDRGDIPVFRILQ